MHFYGSSRDRTCMSLQRRLSKCGSTCVNQMNERTLGFQYSGGSVLTLCPNTRARKQSAKARPAVCLVVAPPTTKPDKGPENISAAKPPSVLSAQQGSQYSNAAWLWETTRGLATNIWGVLRFDRLWWNGEQPQQKQAEGTLLGETTERAVQVGKEQQDKSSGVKKAPANIRRFLHRVGILEIRYIRMLASLCSLTYEMHKATERSLFRLHGLRLVTTSLIYEKMTKEPTKSAYQASDEADGMAASPQLVAGTYHEILKSADREVPEMQAIEKLKDSEPLEKMPAPAELVAARISSAALAAASAAAPLASNISSAAFDLTAAPLQAIGAQLQAAASIGQSTALATIATVTAALESTWGQREVTKKQAVSCSYWFVADDVKAHTRFFVIQGSNNIDHWRINLQFDPVTFEDPAMGLKVHRGFYEAAKVLYDQFLPLVEQHLASSPFAKIVFTGHSLGGGIGTLLMLMFLHRQVISPLALGPVYTFGAPGLFCEANIAGLPRSEAMAKANPEGILERMGLTPSAVRNVMMHRDIVPRAFSCDYALVADLLSRVSDSFKTLPSLQNQARQAMYYTLGKTLILQPDEAQSFVFGGADHPMLPPGPNLFVLRDPLKVSEAADQLTRRLSNNINPASSLPSHAKASGDTTEKTVLPSSADTFAPVSRQELAQPQRRTGGANLGEDGANVDDSGPDKTARSRMGPSVGSVPEAIAALMDNPHPLDILGEPGSYGFKGAISRYHDPFHYTKALGGILRSRMHRWRRVEGDGGTPGELSRLHTIEAPANRSRQRKSSALQSSRAVQWNGMKAAAS